MAKDHLFFGNAYYIFIELFDSFNKFCPVGKVSFFDDAVADGKFFFKKNFIARNVILAFKTVAVKFQFQVF